MLERHTDLIGRVRAALASVAKEAPEGVQILALVRVPSMKDVFTVSNTGSRAADKVLCMMAIATELDETQKLHKQ